MNSNNNNKTNGYSIRLVKDSLFQLLYEAYLEARKHKRNTINQLKFEVNLEDELLNLTNELLNKTYLPRPSICFINKLPIKREVVAADFRDRVVHHLLCSWLFPIFEKQFIYDSYSCRKGKGTLFGINRARKFIRAASNNFHKDCWTLRLDIKGFFMHIDKQLLYDFIIEGLSKVHWKGIPDIELCKRLINIILFANPIETAIFRSPSYMWNNLPNDKSLKYSEPGKGLPIGNLTSQLFANIYLNSLDHFIKRELKIHLYGRYVDDMILVHRDKKVLLDAVGKIRNFLKDKLQLTLHPKKVTLQLASKGFQFLGVYILPSRVYPCDKLRNSINKSNDIMSYYGQISHLNGI